MMHINQLTSNEYTFQIFSLNDQTDLKKINTLNQGYLMSARFFPINGENEKQCWEIFEKCTPDILDTLKRLREENKNFYNNFECKDNFSHTSVSHYRESGVEKINFMEIFYDTKLKQQNEE